jgi:hypothetical protein
MITPRIGPSTRRDTYCQAENRDRDILKATHTFPRPEQIS